MRFNGHEGYEHFLEGRMSYLLYKSDKMNFPDHFDKKKVSYHITENYMFKTNFGKDPDWSTL